MNNAERDMRIMNLEQRAAHLAQDSSSMWASLGDLSRRLIGLAHRVYLLEHGADPMAPDYDALAAEPEAATAGQDSHESAGLEG